MAREKKMVKVELSSEELRRLVSIMNNKVLGSSPKQHTYKLNSGLLEKLTAALDESTAE